MYIKSGTYSGNGTDNRGITGVGFQPEFVFIKGGSQIAVMRSASMAGDVSKAVIGTTALEANLIQSLDSDGFTLGNDARVNAAATTYYYLAIADSGSSDFNEGTYTGDGSDGRSISGAGFQPDMAIVISEGANRTYWTSVEQLSTADRSQRFDSTVLTDRIQALEADGFQVGTAAEVNTNTVNYYWVAFKKVTGFFNIVEYTGDGNDDRSISGVGFTPDFALTQTQNLSAQNAAVRFKDHVGDSSALVGANADAANRIQAFESDGIQLGTTTQVNGSGPIYTAFFFKENAPTTITIDTSLIKVAANINVVQSVPPVLTIGTNLAKVIDNINVSQSQLETISTQLVKVRAAINAIGSTDPNEVWIDTWEEQDP